MSRKFYRRGPWRRLLSTFLVFAFTLSFTGVGFAAPVETEAPADVAAPTADTQEPIADATPPQEEPAPVAEPAPSPEPVVEPAPAVEPAPVGEPVTAEPSVEPAPRSDSPDGPSDARSSRDDAKPDAAPADAEAGVGTAPDAGVVEPIAPVAVAAAPVKTGVQLELEGWEQVPNIKWTNGNPDPQSAVYMEGAWVPYHLVIDNTGGSEPATMGAFKLIYDHYNSNRNAIGVDMTRQWHVQYTDTLPTDGDPHGSAQSPASQDQPYGGGGYGSSPYLASEFATGSVVVPAGQFGIVYFQAHLSLTVWWNQQTPARDGSSAYPGASMQMRVESPSGDKTVSIPIPPAPVGYLDGLKFNDYDHDGVRDAGEPPLAGWVFHLHDGPTGFPLDLHATSGADGTFSFGPLPEATYELSEELQTDWTNSTPLPMTIVMPASRIATDVGNYRADVTKSWELTVDNVPSGATFFVRYSVNGVARPDLPLTGSGPYTASDTRIPWGASVVTSYYASYGGEDLYLDSDGPEVLEEDFTNEFDWDSTISGSKFNDVNANHAWDKPGEPGLGGWTIRLRRHGGAAPVVYAVQVTGSNGAYSFTDVLPGTYSVEESQQVGWAQMLAPTGTFVVSAADPDEADLDFGNTWADGSIVVEKTGVDFAHEGDTITYHFEVTNNGTAPLFNVEVRDPMIGASPLRVYSSLAVSQTVSFDATYTITDPPGDVIHSVDNTVTARGFNLINGPVTDQDTWHTAVIHPHISIDKTVDFDGNGLFSESEQGYDNTQAIWKLVVRNTGDTDLSSVVVTDTNGDLWNVGALAVGSSAATRTYSDPITDSKTNNASSRGTDRLGLTVFDGPDPASVTVIAPRISIQKTVDLDGNASFNNTETGYVGDTAVWKIVVTNPGDVALTSVVVTDTTGRLWNVGTLPAVSGSWNATYATSPADDEFNTAFAVGTDPIGGTKRAQDSAEAIIIGPALSIAKTVDFNADGIFTDDETYYAGRTATWSITVTNTGDVPLTNVWVRDNEDDYGPFDLAVGEAETITYKEAITADKTNTANAVGLDPQENDVKAGPDSASVHPIDPGITIEKTVDFDGDGTFSEVESYYAGAQAVWRIRVINNSDVDLTGVRIHDPENVGGFGAAFLLAAHGGSHEATYATSPFVDTTNWASVTATDPLWGIVEDEDSAAVDPVTPGISVKKQVDFDRGGVFSDVETYYAGMPADWMVVIENTGDTPLWVSDVTDSNGHDFGPAFWLAARATTMTVYSEVIGNTFNDVVDVVPNLVEVEALDPFEKPLGASDTATAVAIAPELVIDKFVDYNGDGEFNAFEDGRLGWTATWKIVVRNSGDVPMVDVSVGDTNGRSFGPFDLDAGASQIITYTTVPTAYTYNTATASGTDPLGGTFGPVAGSAGATPFDPHITLEKIANPTVILSGDMVTYTYRVTNDGDMPLFDIDVSDVPLGHIGHIDYLAVDASSTVSTTVPIGVDTHNDGAVLGHYDSGEESGQPGTISGTVSAEDDADVNVVTPRLSIAKTVEFNGDGTYGEDETALSGSTARWRIVVTNNGEVPLSSVVVTDTNGQSFGPFSLAAGASQQFDYNTNPTANTVNVASATGTYTLGIDTQNPPRRIGPVADSAQVRVFLPFTPPDLAIVKSADATEAAPGETVVYTLTYSNVGRGAASNFTIVDDFDERYVTITDAGGATLAGGKLTWNIAGPLYGGESGSVSYTVRIIDEMPSGTTNVDNVVVITHPDDPNPDNNRDDWRVVVAFLPFTEPFLPFTGGDVWVLLYLGVALAAAGVLFRRLGRQEA